MSISAVKGTHDIYGDEASLYETVSGVFAEVAGLYGYTKITVPTLEHTEVFSRGTGEGSDVVRKEMYTFDDKGGRSLTLRPEFTAGVARAILTNKLYIGDLPLKFYYDGQLFRYERPQAGRYREFHSFGLECVGEDTPYLDAETVLIAVSALSYLGFKGLKVKVNTLGDKAGRMAYRDALREYFGGHIEGMCADCKERLRLNPLRILDCKVEADQVVVSGAPKFKDFISNEAKERFEKTLGILKRYGVEYEVDENLVRGLDYYSGFVYEVHAETEGGKALGALLGGGHYDDLLEALGGPSMAGVGFGAGLERIVSAYKDAGLEDVSYAIDCYLAPLGEDSYEACFDLLTELRANGYAADMAPRAVKLSASFKRAERKKARFVLIIGENEIKEGIVAVKDQKTMVQENVKIDELIAYLDSRSEEEGEHHHE